MADGTEREDMKGISIDEFMGASGDSSSGASGGGGSGSSSIEGAIDDIFNIEDINLDDISLADLMIDDLDDDGDNADTTADDDTGSVAEAAEGQEVSEEQTVQAEKEMSGSEQGQPGDTPLAEKPESTQPGTKSVQAESGSMGAPESAEDSKAIAENNAADIDAEDIDLMQLLTGGDEDEDELSPRESQDNPGKNEKPVSDGENSGSKRKSKKDNVFADPLSVLSDNDDDDVGVEEVEGILDNVKAKSKKKKKKSGKGIGKIFSNIVDEKELEKVEKEKKDAELAEKKKEAEAEKKQKQAEEKAGRKEEKKLAKAQLKESKKQEKEAKKQAKKEAKELRKLEEETEIEGRINKVGAAVVFVLIGGLAIFLYVGTKMFSYNSSVSNARSYYENGRYEESYNELVGIELKEEDMPLYNKVVTIMYVYKQLDAYDTYYKAERYPQALDSLLKGIREYERYMPDAIEFDITDNFDSIKNQMIGELSAEYGITEDMAREINSLTDSAEYSKRVYDLAQNLSSNYY